MLDLGILGIGLGVAPDRPTPTGLILPIIVLLVLLPAFQEGDIVDLPIHQGVEHGETDLMIVIIGFDIPFHTDPFPEEDVQGLEHSKTPEGYPLYRVLVKPDVEGADLCPAIYRLAQEHAWPLRELRRDVRTLETVFNQLATAV